MCICDGITNIVGRLKIIVDAIVRRKKTRQMLFMC